MSWSTYQQGPSNQDVKPFLSAIVVSVCFSMPGGGLEKVSKSQATVTDLLLTLRLTGAKSERAETFRNRREAIVGTSECAGGVVVVSKSLSAICK